MFMAGETHDYRFKDGTVLEWMGRLNAIGIAMDTRP
jgi:hypothetical protein